MKNENIKKIIKISLIIILFINSFICLSGLLLRRPIIIYDFIDNNTHIYDLQINVFILISIIVINILLIILTINKFNKNKLIVGITFFILIFLIPVYKAYGTKTPVEPNSYLMGAIPVHKYYNVYGIEIYNGEK